MLNFRASSKCTAFMVMYFIGICPGFMTKEPMEVLMLKFALIALVLLIIMFHTVNRYRYPGGSLVSIFRYNAMV